MATAESTATETAATEAAVQLYIDGASKGTSRSSSRGSTTTPGCSDPPADSAFNMPTSQMAEIINGQPLDSDGCFSACARNHGGRTGRRRRNGQARRGRLLGEPVVRRLLRAGEDRRHLEDRQQDVRPHRRGDARGLVERDRCAIQAPEHEHGGKPACRMSGAS